MSKVRPLPPLSVLWCALSLAGCAGGGTRSVPPTITQTPPPAEQTVWCLPPYTGDCLVKQQLTWTGGRDSPFALRVHLPYDFSLSLGDGTSPGDRYVFAGGTFVDYGGYVWVAPFNTLVSNVVVEVGSSIQVDGNVEGNILIQPSAGRDPGYATHLNPGSHVQGNLDNSGFVILSGQLTGDVANSGELWFAGGVDGDVANTGRMQVDGIVHPDPGYPIINGDFSQAAGGTFAFMLAPGGAGFQAAPLQVSGEAHLDGTLQLGLYSDDFGPYPLPALASYDVIHAAGGVFGQFTSWEAPGLFVEGNARYGTNDVWFDLNRISVQAVMAAGADATTLASAGNLDRALGSADGFAQAPPSALTEAQRRFLRSAASILYQRDFDQATRSLDSIDGHAYSRAGGALQLRAASTARQLDARLSRASYDANSTAWSQDFVDGDFAGRGSGYEQWLNPHLLVGDMFVQDNNSLPFGRLGGQATGDSHAAGVYAHYRGEGWHASGLLGAERATLQLQRPIELGAAGQHVATSRRLLDQVFAHGEIGRDLPLAGGRLVPYAALDASLVRGDAFSEAGDSGLELVAGPSRQAQLSGAMGARYAYEWTPWTFGGAPLQFEVDATFQRALADASDPSRARFAGVPDTWFDLPGQDNQNGGALRMGLRGGFGQRTTWWLDYARGQGGLAEDGAWHVGLRYDL